MPAVRNFFRELKNVRYGLETYKELFFWCIDKIAKVAGGKSTNFYSRERYRRLVSEFMKGDIYVIKDAKLPAANKGEENGIRVINLIDMDIFSSYLYHNDRYDEDLFDLLDSMLPEGLYGLVNDRVNVTVEAGDIVIDAGSCCGSFSAYASAKGASLVYAFEPVKENFAYLRKTAELNQNIVPVNKGLSDENTSMNIFINPDHFSASSFIEKQKPGIYTSQTETVKLDDFVQENNIERIDFIKADIEGFERHMLAGAQETLRRFSPKLALCTYHLPDDPEVMTSLIKQANPKYNIVQKKCKLFASVPE